MRLAQLIARTGDQEAVVEILCHLLSLDRTAVFLLPDIDDTMAVKVIHYMDKYHRGTPLGYILGYAYFANRKFMVNQDVLIPRYDTEVLVDLAEKKVITDSVLGIMDSPYRILDLCCGSGIIGICLGYLTDWLHQKNPQDRFEITAADISEKALAVARTNAQSHGMDINFVQSDLFTNIIGQYDLIVCNPPYIRTLEIGLEDHSILKEPRIALNGGLDGLYFYRRILATVSNHLRTDGVIMFEVGYDQAEDVRMIGEQYGFSRIKIYKDLANNDRVVTLRK